MSLDIQQEETKDKIYSSIFSKYFSKKNKIKRRKKNSSHLIMIIMQMSIA
jgi:hypothetical protein